MFTDYDENVIWAENYITTITDRIEVMLSSRNNVVLATILLPEDLRSPKILKT